MNRAQSSAHARPKHLPAIAGRLKKGQIIWNLMAFILVCGWFIPQTVTRFAMTDGPSRLDVTLSFSPWPAQQYRAEFLCSDGYWRNTGHINFPIILLQHSIDFKALGHFTKEARYYPQ